MRPLIRWARGSSSAFRCDWLAVTWPADPIQPPFLIHATAVSLADKGLLILGASGRGKSALALRLIGMGAKLVADDQVLIAAGPQGPVARAAVGLEGLIEARHVGILRLQANDSTVLHLIVDLDQTETERLPPKRSRELTGFALEVVHGSQIDHLAPALICYLMGERQG